MVGWNIEYEVKYKVSCENLQRLADTLESVGFRALRVVREVDVYFDHPCRNFSESDEALRLRLSGDKAALAYKGPRRVDKAKSREEIEVTLSGPVEGLREILSRLGFREAVRVVKDRVYYAKGGVIVTLDRVEELGCFVEAESGKGFEELSDIVEVIRKFGFEVKETYAEMMAKGMRDR